MMLYFELKQCGIIDCLRKFTALYMFGLEIIGNKRHFVLIMIFCKNFTCIQKQRNCILRLLDAYKHSVLQNCFNWLYCNLFFCCEFGLWNVRKLTMSILTLTANSSFWLFFKLFIFAKEKGRKKQRRARIRVVPGLITIRETKNLVFPFCCNF